MTKPKYIQGEAKGFIDIVADIERENISIEEMFSRMKEVHAFITQPFTPEMIIELFEGWEISIKRDDVFYCGNNQANFSHTPNYYLTPYAYINAKFFPIPKTLNDFISDANRSGIKLKWRVE